MIYIGCISGTSVDALDLAAVEIHEQTLDIIAAGAAELPAELRSQLLELGQPEQIHDIEAVAAADAALGTFTGASVRQFMQQHNLHAGDVAAVGSHGQTIRHRPGAFTVQIGDPNRIAEIAGLTTVADFRRRDMAAGGEGAPLVPPFHQALFAGRAGVDSNAVLLNIGGISNVTVLSDPPLGFDTGPGNALLDSWCSQHHNQDYDAQGRWAESGRLDRSLLQQMLQDPYFSTPPPKSTGREYFNTGWLLPLLQNQAPADVQRTLCELTAQSISGALQRWAPDAAQILVCGGGRLNTFLLQRLQANHAAAVTTTESVGVDGDSLEAAAFAWLAYRTLNTLSGNEPAVTGAEGYRVLGGVYSA